MSSLYTHGLCFQREMCQSKSLGQHLYFHKYSKVEQGLNATNKRKLTVNRVLFRLTNVPIRFSAKQSSIRLTEDQQ